MKILLLLQHDDAHLTPDNFHALSAARQFGEDIDALLIGHASDAVLAHAKKTLPVRCIHLADAADYAHELPENTAPLIATLAKDYDVLLTASTTYAKNILPRVAALLDVMMISEVTNILSPTVFVRPIYAGNAFLTLESQDRIKVITVRKTAFSPAKKEENPEMIVQPVTEIIPNTQSEFIDETLTVSTRPELTDARIVVSGGRAFKSADHFKQLERFADSIGAAVGASRAAVDAGFAPNDYQVGQTGKIVAPDLYIAIGISGAIQHLAGMKDSKVIVAINNDPEAPIFQIADYGLVGDLFTILPELQDELSKEMKCD